MTDQTKNNILFPDNTAEEMYSILKQNGLEKANNITFYGAILGRLMKEVAVGEISFEQFTDALSQEMQIDKEKAQQIAQEAKIKILNPINASETQSEKQKPSGPDDYREPVE